MSARTLLLAVVLIGVLALVSVVGIIALAMTSHEIPDVLVGMASGSLTGLVGLLVQSRPEDA